MRHLSDLTKVGTTINGSWYIYFKPNEDDRDGEVPYHSREKLEIMISDYNKKFETNFSTDTTNEYFNHISKTLKGR